MVGAKFSEEGKLKKENLKSYLKARVPHSQNGLHHHHQEIQHLHLPPPPGLRPPGHPRHRKVLPGKLVSSGMDTPEKLMGLYLVSARNPEKMKHWLVSNCSIRAQEAGKISEAMDRKSQGAMVVC